MSLHRTALFILAALFTAGLSSAASACCGWGVAAPVAYAPTGCGGCGTPTAAIVYAEPVAPAPPPVAVSTWGGGGCGCACGCRGFLSYAVPGAEVTPIAPAPIYVVNQGPDFTGPGIMVPYHTWTPAASYVVPGSYPYLPGYGYGYGYRHYGYGIGYRQYGYGHRYGLHRGFVAPRARFAYHAGFRAHPFHPGVRPALHPAIHPATHYYFR